MQDQEKKRIYHQYMSLYFHFTMWMLCDFTIAPKKGIQYLDSNVGLGIICMSILLR